MNTNLILSGLPDGFSRMLCHWREASRLQRGLAELAAMSAGTNSATLVSRTPRWQSLRAGKPAVPEKRAITIVERAPFGMPANSLL